MAGEPQEGAEALSVLERDKPDRSALPARIVVAGSDLLVGALAGALTTYGFDTMQIPLKNREIKRVLEWQPDLVLIDSGDLDVTSGSTLIRRLRRTDIPVCVIDSSDDSDRLRAWSKAGASEMMNKSEPFDQLFRTINRLLRIDDPAQTVRGSSARLAVTPTDKEQPDSRTQCFLRLTEREQVVLANLMEGHCAEEIANASFVSISTVRSQIKSILQKLGVNSQLAAVAMARRAAWSLDIAPETASKPQTRRRRQVS